MPPIGPPEPSLFMTAYRFASPCGHATAELWITAADANRFAYLWDLTVEDAHQGRGIGGALLNETIAFVRARALPYLLQPAANLPSDEVRLRRFYRAHGFVDGVPQTGSGLVGMVYDPASTRTLTGERARTPRDAIARATRHQDARARHPR